MKNTVSLFFVLALLWWVLSGYAKPLLIGLGLVSIAFTLFMSYRMNVVDEESHPTYLGRQLIPFWLYLLAQIVISNIQMIRLILSPRPDLDPQVVRVAIAQRSDLGKVILGNSITLTPGTVTLDFDNHADVIEVHAINRAAAADIIAGTFDKRVPVRREERS